MKKSLLYIISNFILLFSFQIYSQTITWSETQPSGNSNRNWATTSMSSDGSKIIAGIYDVSVGRLYLSTDGGANWSETQPAGNASKNWITTSMSSDGSKIIAGVNGLRLYITTNGGANWNETQPAGDNNKNWKMTAMSSDGSKIIAGDGPIGRLYKSTDVGLSWSEIQPIGNVDNDWRQASMSSDGQKIIVIGGLRLYLTTDGGNTWNETRPKGDVNANWHTTSMSSNGQIIIAGIGVSSDRIYITTDGGNTWNETQPKGNVNANWYTTSMSSDGQIILAGEWGGKLYITTNAGINWNESAFASNWSTSSMSSDGAKAIAGVSGGRIYLNNQPLPVELNSFSAKLKDDKVELNWQTATEVNNYGFEIERSVAQISNLCYNWEKIGFAAGHGNSNSPKDYSFVDPNPPSGKLQYRLKQIDTDGSFEYSQVVEVETELPKQFSLEQNYPNPFNPTTTIKYSIPMSSFDYAQDDKSSVMVIRQLTESNHDNADVIPSLSNKYNADVIPIRQLTDVGDEIHVTLKIYDILGREVATLVDEYQKPGTYNYQLSTSNYQLSSGVYFYKLQSGSFIQTKKMLLLK